MNGMRPEVRARLASEWLSIVSMCLCAEAWAAAVEGKDQKGTPPTGKHHVLKATQETVQWGWLDPSEKPKLTINSGDTVSIETMSHSLGAIHPGVSMEEIVRLRKANPGGGPHSITGPVFVNGAEPGDVMEVRILKIVPY